MAHGSLDNVCSSSSCSCRVVVVVVESLFFLLRRGVSSVFYAKAAQGHVGPTCIPQYTSNYRVKIKYRNPDVARIVEYSTKKFNTQCNLG